MLNHDYFYPPIILFSSIEQWRDRQFSDRQPGSREDGRKNAAVPVPRKVQIIWIPFIPIDKDWSTLRQLYGDAGESSAQRRSSVFRDTRLHRRVRRIRSVALNTSGYLSNGEGGRVEEEGERKVIRIIETLPFVPYAVRVQCARARLNGYGAICRETQRIVEKTACGIDAVYIYNSTMRFCAHEHRGVIARRLRMSEQKRAGFGRSTTRVSRPGPPRGTRIIP